LPEGTEMVMPGDTVKISVKLVTPVALEEKQRFAIREGGKTVGAGVVTKIICLIRDYFMATTRAKTKKTKDDGAVKLRIRVRAYENKILDASVKQILDTARRYEALVHGPIPMPTEIKKVHSKSFTIRLQKYS
jgi:hypothetical protein